MTTTNTSTTGSTANAASPALWVRRALALCCVLAVHAAVLWLWWQPKQSAAPAALAMVMAPTENPVPEQVDEAIEPQEAPDEVVEAAEPENDQEAPAAEQASADAMALGGGDGDVTALPLALRWPTGNSLLDLASAEGLVLLVLDVEGQPVGHVDLHSGVFRTGMPSALAQGDWDPEARLLPHPPARVFSTLAGQPRDHRVAVLAPRQRIAEWTAASAGRDASFVRSGGAWRIH